MAKYFCNVHQLPCDVPFALVAINLIVQHIKAILARTVGIASRPPPELEDNQTHS